MTNSINTSHIAPEVLKRAIDLGQRIRLARKRRELRVEDVAEKARVGKKTVEAVERGALTTSLGAYLAVLGCMGLDGEVDLVADPAIDRDGAELVYSRIGERVRPARKVDNDF